MKRHIWAALFPLFLSAQTLTTVSDTLIAPDGSSTNLNGSIYVEMTGFCTQGSNTIRPAPIQIIVKNGVLKTRAGATGQPLVPSDSCSEGETLYRVRYDVRGPAGPIQVSRPMYWNVPTSGSPVSIDSIETANAGTASATLPITGLTGLGENQMIRGTATTPGISSLTDNGDGVMTLFDPDGPNTVIVKAGSAQTGSDLFRIENNSGVYLLRVADNGALQAYSNGVAKQDLFGSSHQFSSDGGLNWKNNTNVNAGAVDIILNRLSAGVLKQASSATAQGYCWYGLDTDASNYERLCLQTTAGTGVALTAGTAGSGGDNLHIDAVPAGTGEFRVINADKANGAVGVMGRIRAGADGALGPLDLLFIAKPSATGSVRYAGIYAGDSGDVRPIVLGVNSTENAFANVLIGTADFDGTPAVGRLVVQGSTNDGTSNIWVGRDSDAVNVAWIDTDGVYNTLAGSYKATSANTTQVIRYGADNTSPFLSADNADAFIRVLTNPAGGGVTEKFRFVADGQLQAVELKLANSTEGTCNSGSRGRIVPVFGGVGVADSARMCVKNAADSYEWIPIV